MMASSSSTLEDSFATVTLACDAASRRAVLPCLVQGNPLEWQETHFPDSLGEDTQRVFRLRPVVVTIVQG
jgi:hypothetical protein